MTHISFEPQRLSTTPDPSGTIISADDFDHYAKLAENRLDIISREREEWRLECIRLRKLLGE